MFALLNTSDAASIEAYERSLFRAFTKYLDDPATKLIWDVDVATERISMRVPYADQLIGVAWEGDVVMAATAVNLNRETRWQAEMLGFNVDKSQPGTCEALVVFSNQKLFPKPQVLLFSHVAQSVAYILKTQHQINLIYGSCAEWALPGQRLAAAGIFVKHSGQSFFAGSTLASARAHGNTVRLPAAWK